MAYRFFGTFLDNSVTLSSDDVFHLTKVLRIKEKEVIEVVAGDLLYICNVKSFNPFALQVISFIPLQEEKKPHITLIYALPKGDKLDLVVQKSVELGVSEIILIEAQNAVVKFKNEKQDKKLERFHKIMRSAAMQSKRNIIPSIRGPLSFNEMLKLPFSLKLIAHEKALVPFPKLLNEIPNNISSISVLIGPEGGFSDKEVLLAQESGYNVISFGTSILRSETAVFYALSVLNNYKEGLNV